MSYVLTHSAAGETVEGQIVPEASAADSTILISFYLSRFSYHGPFSEYLAGVDVITPIAAGETVTVAVPPTLAVPEDQDAGDFYLLVVVDDQEEVGELNENNDLVVTAVTVGAHWTFQTVDAEGGAYTSLALDSSDTPHISYLRDSKLGYATLQDGSWQLSFADDAGLDDAGNPGFYTSVTTDAADYPCISYYDYGLASVKYSRWNGATWEIELIGDGDPDATSIGFDSSAVPHVVYRSSYLTHAYRSVPPDWTIETVDHGVLDDTMPATGHGAAMVVDSVDTLHVSYGTRNASMSESSSVLVYAKLDGTGWYVGYVDASAGVGPYTSIAVDSLDYPHISYSDSGNGGLKYAHK